MLLYLDDVIVLAPDCKEGVRRLELVLRIACEYDLEVNKKKYQFMKRCIEFLGQVVENGRYLSPDKIKAVINFPQLKSTKDITKFP